MWQPTKLLFILLVIAGIPRNFAQGAVPESNKATQGDWQQYGRTAEGDRYVNAGQITKENVDKLKKVWEFHTHDISDEYNKPSSTFECTPIMVDDTLYVVSPFNRVFALDPDSGKLKWDFDPKIYKLKPVATEAFTCRGVTAWKDPKSGKVRIFLATYDGRLIGLDGTTGEPITQFGNNGSINLKRGVGTRYLHDFHETSAPCVIGNLVVVGSSIVDNVAVDMPLGVVRAFSAVNGKLAWTWNPVAHFPSLSKFENTKDSKYLKGAKTGAGNAWAPISADPARGLIFVPTGSASPDYFGGFRPGDDADADSIVCLDAKNGKEVWRFQTVHHNLWDYDVPAEPIVCKIGKTPAVIALTKMGFVFVLNELTGKPLFPVKEMKVPTNGVPGENLSPTQPFPTLPKPLVPTQFQPWALTEKYKAFIAERIKGKRSDGIYTPIGFNGTIVLPGGLGGCNWSGGSYDPTSDTLFVSTNNIPNIITMVKRSDVKNYNQTFDQIGAPYAVNWRELDAPNLVPATKPPWGVMHAINMKTGLAVWQKPLGQMPQFADLPESKQWGAINLGGSFCTSTGLVFIAASVNPVLRAFDSATGKILWKVTLPAGGQATPMSFISPKTGRQYVVQCAGGHGGFGGLEGDSVIAYAIP